MILKDPDTYFKHNTSVPTQELVHMNRYETTMLDDLQGGPDYDKDGVKTYNKLGAYAHNPNMEKLFTHHAREHKAKGGHLGMPQHLVKMREMGRYGDDQLVRVPSNLTKIWDKEIGGASINPHTGRKEYFLGALIPALTSLLPMAARALPALGSMFGTAARAAAPMARAAMGGASALGRGAMSAGRAIASNPTMQTLGRGAMGLGRMGYQGMQAAGNVANAVLPMTMLHDRFGGGQQQQQQQQQQQPDMYEQAYNQQFSPQQTQPMGGYSSSFGGGSAYEPMMDLGNPGGSSYNRGAGSRGGMGYSSPMSGGYSPMGGGGYSPMGMGSSGGYSSYGGGGMGGGYPMMGMGGGSYGGYQPPQYGGGGYSMNPSMGMGGGYPSMSGGGGFNRHNIYRSS